MISTHHSNSHLSSSTDIPFSIWHTFKSHIPRFLLTIVCDVLCPLILFLVLEKRMKTVYALLIAGLPPLFMIFIKVILSCTFDALGFLVCLSFLTSAFVAILTNNEIILLLEKSLVTILMSMIFGLTLIPCPCWRPLAYYFYQDFVPIKRKDLKLSNDFFDQKIDRSSKEEVNQVYEWMYKHFSSFRLSCYLITNIWFLGFLFQFLVRSSLILLRLSINQMIIYGHILLSLITIICIILTIICIIKERKQTLESIHQHLQLKLPNTSTFNVINIEQI